MFVGAVLGGEGVGYVSKTGRGVNGGANAGPLTSLSSADTGHGNVDISLTLVVVETSSYSLQMLRLGNWYRSGSRVFGASNTCGVES